MTCKIRMAFREFDPRSRPRPLLALEFREELLVLRSLSSTEDGIDTPHLTQEPAMSSDAITRTRPRLEDKFVTVDGLRTRYIEEGEGPPVLLLHGASLGSSADVFIRNLGPARARGLPRHRLRPAGLRPDRCPRRSLARLSPRFHPQIHGRARPLPRRARRPFAGRQSRRAARAQGARPLFACDRARHRKPAAAARWRGRCPRAPHSSVSSAAWPPKSRPSRTRASCSKPISSITS